MNKQSWIVPAAALMLAGALTACGTTRSLEDRPGETNGQYQTQQNGSGNTMTNDNRAETNGTGNSNGAAANNGTMNGTNNNTNINTDTNARRTGKKAPENSRNKRTSSTHRSAYDYLNDGRYVAGQNGKVYGKDDNRSPVEDLTQGARDLIRSAADAARDVGDKAGDTVRDGMK